MRYPFQSTSRPISHRNMWSFRVYMIPLRDFVQEWNSRPGTTTWVNSRWGESRRHDILWWYHVNKCRAMTGNRSELTPGRVHSVRKSPRCHVNTPLSANLWAVMHETFLLFSVAWPNLSDCPICVSVEMKRPVEMILSFIPSGWWEYLLSMLSRTYLLK